MALRGWSWDATIRPAGLGDRPLLEALEVAIPDGAGRTGLVLGAMGSGARRWHRP
jgi:hypothetical protein